VDVCDRPADRAGRQAPADVSSRVRLREGRLREEQTAKQQFGKVDLAADGSVAAELTQWLGERELDIAVTTLSNYRNAVAKYVIPFLGVRQLTHWTNAPSTIFTGT
jgi:hypothetical protein